MKAVIRRAIVFFLMTLAAACAWPVIAADIPQVKPAWRADVRARMHPLHAPDSDDFSDLQFLKPLLAGKRVVQLGESSHGVAEFNLAKVRLVKFLHQQMGYDVIAVEGSLGQCHDADRAVGTLPPREIMQRCFFPNWRTAQGLPLFDYLAAARKSSAPLTLAGFDSLDSAPGVEHLLRLQTMLEALDSPLASSFAAMKARMAATDGYLPPAEPAGLQAFAAQSAQLIGAQRARLLAKGISADDIDLARQVAITLGAHVEYLSTPGDARYARREKMMAENLNFLLDRLYPNRKVIVWAHNDHIARQPADATPKLMGSYLAERRKAELYTVGIFMGSGAQKFNDGKVVSISPPAPETMEAVLANGAATYGLVDFSRAKAEPASAWMFEPIIARSWGINPQAIIPSQAYDAVLYIDTVTPTSSD